MYLPFPCILYLQGKPIYDAGEPKTAAWISAFTRRREIFAGRIAMVSTFSIQLHTCGMCK
jgi:hypothetical protein